MPRFNGILSAPAIPEHIYKPPDDLQFKHGTPDVAEATVTTFRLLTLLNLIGDIGLARDYLTQEYTRLANHGYDGRLYITLSPEQASFERLIKVAGRLHGKSVERYADLWTPFSSKNYKGYTLDELNGTDKLGASLAVFNATATGYDPMLFGLGLAYNTEPAKHGAFYTQLDLVGTTIAQHSKLDIRPSTHRDFLIWSIMDIIREVPVSKQALANGGMRIPTLGRRVLPNYGSAVGNVYSFNGQLWFSGDNNREYYDEYDRYGIGLSVG
jgi:hypothetical protein